GAGLKESFVPLSFGMRSDLPPRRVQSFFFELPGPVASARARAEREQAGAEEQECHRFGDSGRGRRAARDALRRVFMVGRADAAHADERDAGERPPWEAALRDGELRNLAAVADRPGHVAEVNGLDVAAAL